GLDPLPQPDAGPLARDAVPISLLPEERSAVPFRGGAVFSVGFKKDNQVCTAKSRTIGARARGGLTMLGLNMRFQAANFVPLGAMFWGCRRTARGLRWR